MDPKETKQQPTGLALIKQQLMAPAALLMFKDNLPTAIGAEADKAASRFAKMVYTAICQNPTLQSCSVPSLIRASSISASLGLDIDSRGLAYLVPYLNKQKDGTKAMEAQFQIGYLGLIELAYRSGKVKAISAHCIYESEKDIVKITRTDGRFVVEHPFTYKKPTGKVIAVYATAEVEGLGPQTIVLRSDEVEDLRKCSKAPNSPAWSNFPEAMYKKTAIRQLAKFLPKSILEDFQKGASMDEQETFVEAQVSAAQQIEGQAGSQAIEAAFEQTGESEGQQEAPQVVSNSRPAFLED